MPEQQEKSILSEDAKRHIDLLVKNASQAAEEFLSFSQEQVDRIVYAMALSGIDRHMELAKMAVAETGRGIYEDKITKNLFVSELGVLYHQAYYGIDTGSPSYH